MYNSYVSTEGRQFSQDSKNSWRSNPPYNHNSTFLLQFTERVKRRFPHFDVCFIFFFLIHYTTSSLHY